MENGNITSIPFTVMCENWVSCPRALQVPEAQTHPCWFMLVTARFLGTKDLLVAQAPSPGSGGVASRRQWRFFCFWEYGTVWHPPVRSQQSLGVPGFLRGHPEISAWTGQTCSSTRNRPIHRWLVGCWVHVSLRALRVLLLQVIGPVGGFLDRDAFPSLL